MSKNFRLGKFAQFSALSLVIFSAGCAGYVPPAPLLPAATFSSSQVSFASTAQGSASNPIVVTVTNSGSGPLIISSVVAGGANPGDFVTSNSCIAALSPYVGFCTISVVFQPAATGQRSETITITDNAPDSPQVIQVSGTATPPPQPAVTVSQNSVTFPTTTQGTTSNPVVVTVTNSGTAALTVSSIALGGANTADFASTNTCSSAVAPSANCTLSLTFKPTATGQRSETITITDNAPDSPQVIQVSGTATPPPQPALTLSQNQVGFPSTVQGATSAAIVVTVTNSGTAPLNISSITFGGANTADFASTNTCSSAVAPGNNCAISVTFAPQATGQRSETITLTDNAPDSPQIIQVSGTATPAPQPAVTVSQNVVTFPAITQGATVGPVAVTVTNTGTAPLNISAITFGGANPSSFTSTNTCSAAIAVGANCAISLTFAPQAAGALTETVTLTDNAPDSPQIINVSGTANAIALTMTPPQAAMAVGQTLQFSAAGDPNGVTWSVAGVGFAGSASAVAAGTVDSNGVYMPPAASPSFFATVTATSKTDNTKTASATVNVVAPGAFTNTNNVQVAQYAVTPPAAANVSVQFGLDTNYGLTTWTQPAPADGNPVSLYVAGMKQSTAYHMRGVIQFADGTSLNDADFTFTTGALPAGVAPNITTTTTAGMTPQSGVEVLDLISFGGAASTNSAAGVVTDLSGNVLWTYSPAVPLAAGSTIQPIKLLPNGHFLISYVTASGGVATGSVLQEVDLGSNLIWQMTSADLNTALASANCAECNVTIKGLHHDIAILPNGHLILLTDTTQTLPDGSTPTGDVLIDVGDIENVGGANPNHLPQPTWIWNEFNHLDTNRRPYSYPDWTHSNAVIYSKDDGNLIVSSRHQNWLIKVDYANGSGDGHVVWRLGYQGDFVLLNAVGAIDFNDHDWFFAQHYPSFVSTNTSGKFRLTLFDNGDDRGVVDVVGGTCGTGQPVACYSTVPVFDIDETAMTATLVIHPTTEDYSFFGGSAQGLNNGNLEYAESANTSLPGTNGTILEVTQSTPSQTVWKMVISGQYAYRGERKPSLYPGVQW